MKPKKVPKNRIGIAEYLEKTDKAEIQKSKKRNVSDNIANV